MLFYSIPPGTGFGKESKDNNGNGICEDTLHFVDASGYTCESNVGYDCLDPMCSSHWVTLTNSGKRSSKIAQSRAVCVPMERPLSEFRLVITTLISILK